VLRDCFERILVICTRQIGDVLLTTPLIDAARRHWPEARIDVLGFAGTLGMLRGNPQIDGYVEVAAGSGWLQSLALIRRLWRRYDLALIALYSDRAHLSGAVAARRRSGLVTTKRAHSWWKRALLDHAVPVDVDPTHAVLEKLRLIAPWVAPPEAVRVQPPPGRPLPGAVALRLRERYVVIQVPTLVRYKQWPIAHCIVLAAGLIADGLQVVLSGGPSAADRARTAEVARGVGAAGSDDRLLDLAGALDLNQVVTLLRGAALYIGPDTSITHLAAACGTPLLALYGPIDPRLFGPWPQGHAPVQPYLERAMRQQPRGDGAPASESSAPQAAAPRSPASPPSALPSSAPQSLVSPASSPSHSPAPPPITLLQGDPSCVPCNGMGCEGHVESRSDCLETMSPQRVLAEARTLLGGAPLDVRWATIPIRAVSGRPRMAGA
jgi:heptosyltransferase-3